ncbi:MAG TPA: transglycosylase domain-containing protein [Ktedonobacterales bacterium]
MRAPDRSGPSGPRRAYGDDRPRAATSRGGDTPPGGRYGGSGPSSRPPRGNGPSSRPPSNGSYGSDGSNGRGGGGRGRPPAYGGGDTPDDPRGNSGSGRASGGSGGSGGGRPPSGPRRAGNPRDGYRDDRDRRGFRDEEDDYSAPYSAPRRASGRGGRGGGRSVGDRMRDAGRNLSQQFSVMMESVGRAVRAEPRGFAGRPMSEVAPSRSARPFRPSNPAVSPALAATIALGSIAYRRSRGRLLARKWRMARTPRNPMGRIVGISSLLLVIAAIVGAGSAGGVYAAQYYAANRGAIRNAWIAGNNQSTRIFDRNGTLLYATTNAAGYQYNVPYNYINPVVIKATVDTEDRTFWTNSGLNAVDTVRALYVDLSHGGSAQQGASTITQQLVKLLVLQNGEKTLDRKIHEAILALGITKGNGFDSQGYEKWQIMQMYLNNISYRYPNTGIEAAARNYFGLQEVIDPTTHTVKEFANQQLNLAQIAILVRIPNDPNYYMPDYPIVWSCKTIPCPENQWQSGGGDEPHILQGAEVVLGNMLAVGDINQATYDQTVAQDVSILENQQIYYEKGVTQGTTNSLDATKKAPNFVDYVLGQLETQYGLGDLNTVAAAGLSVYTTLDYNLESFMEQDAASYVNGDPVNHQLTRYWYCPGGAPVCTVPSLSQTDNVHNAAGVAIDPWTGDILAMMGTVNYASTDKQVEGFVNMATAAQSMGSSTKPLVYSTAFQMGWNPATVLQDSPICFPGMNPPPQPDPAHPDPNIKWIPDAAAPACTTADHKGQFYTPHDYNATSFSGSAPIRVMLANSLNIPATETQYFVGANGDTASRFLAMVGRMGIATCQTCTTAGVISAARLGPTTSLGTQEIPLVDLTSAYGTFPAGGLHAPKRSILRIDDNQGNTLWTAPTPHPGQAMSPQAAYMITSILTDNKARAGDFGIDNPLYLPNPAAPSGDTASINYPYIAAKTGTAQGTSGPSDVVTMGYSPYMVLGVWAGNTDPHDDLNQGIIGITGVGYIFHDVMAWAVRHYKWPMNQGFAVPPGLARGMFNCNTGLAPYKGATSPDPNNLLGPGPNNWWWCRLSDQAVNGQATNLYDGFDTGPWNPDIDWYIEGQYPIQS